MTQVAGVECADCGATLPAQARFCPSCGAARPEPPASCRSCDAQLLPGARYCHACGASVDAPPPAPLAPVAERRVTSVLFGDLVAFTTLAEARDAEETRELLSRYFAECRTVVARYGGTVEKFIGDAVMAVWGAPVAHEDDASRAVLAGLELVDTVAAFGARVGAPGLAMRVGVVSGEVAVTVGATGEGMVAGDAVNTAARVQSTAKPGQVWVDDTTRGLTARTIEYRDEGAHLLKGKADPVRLHSARAVVGDVTSGQRADGLEARMYGRDRELRTLKELFHAVEESRRPRLVVVDGEPGVGKSRLAWEFEKYVDGLSGTVRWHRGRCLSYGEGVVFWALSEAVRTRFGLVEGDTGAVVDERLDTGLARIVADESERAWLRPRIAVLIGAGVEGTYAREELFAAWSAFFERVGASDPVLMVIDDAEHADDALLDFIEHLLATAHAAIFVLVLARPDLLARRPGLGGRRASVIRLDTLDDAEMGRLVDDLVDRLPSQERDALVRRAEGVPLFAMETVRALIDRDLVVPSEGRYVPAEGVPVDLDAVGAPGSLHALVASRLDALRPAERRVLTDASVLGKTFTRARLAALAAALPGLPAGDLDEALAGLCRKEILTIQRDPFAAAFGQYRFVQTIVRQVAYATQSRRDRKLRHLAAAEHLSSDPDVGDELSVVLAQHLLDAVDASGSADPDVPELTSRATALLETAARRALSLGATAEAVRLFGRALAHTDDPTVGARLHEGAARAAGATGDHDTAIAHSVTSIRLYDELGDVAGAGRAVALQASALSGRRDNRAAIEVARPRLAALEQLPGSSEVDTALADLYAILATTHLYLGEMPAARAFAERSVRLAEAMGDPGRTALAMAQLSIQFFLDGARLTGQAILEGAAGLARRHGATTELGWVLMSLISARMDHDLPGALEVGREAVEVSRRSGHLLTTNLTLQNQVCLLWTAGRLAEAAERLAELGEPAADARVGSAQHLLALWLDDAMGRPSTAACGDGPDPFGATDNQSERVWNDALRLARLRASGDRVEAARFADAALDRLVRFCRLDDDFMHLWPPMVLAAVEAGDVAVAERLLAPVTGVRPGLVSPALRAHALRLRGLVAALRGDPAGQVEADLRAGVVALRDFGAVGFAAQAQVELADWLVGQGRPSEASEHYRSALATFERIGALGWRSRLEQRVAGGVQVAETAPG
ncbi:adenylate/guanylate cyclase domain-containing protein [Intrasporangium sp.]|uniref:AAA family ATPase n=1 Tax=Intrasporangium sp. TaxID=1925024 RepID=UPI0032221061